jgi:hypothetical protein
MGQVDQRAFGAIGDHLDRVDEVFGGRTQLGILIGWGKSNR